MGKVLIMKGNKGSSMGLFSMIMSFLIIRDLWIRANPECDNLSRKEQEEVFAKSLVE